MKTYSAHYRGQPITLTLEALGSDLLLTCTGGDMPHVGSVSLAQPYAAADGRRTACSSSVSAYAHRDAQLGDRMAALAAKRTGKTVAVVCGVHFDALAPEALEPLTRLCLELCEYAAQEAAE